MVNPQGMLGDGVLVATNLNTAFHNQWKPKQPAGRVQVVTKVLKTRKVIWLKWWTNARTTNKQKDILLSVIYNLSCSQPAEHGTEAAPATPLAKRQIILPTGEYNWANYNFVKKLKLNDNKKDKLNCDKSANRSLESSFGEGKRKQRRTPEEEGFQQAEQAADLLGSALQHEVWDRGKTACTHENTPGMKTKSDLFFNWLISLISQLGIWPSVLKWTEGLSYDIWLFEIIFYNKSVKVYEHLQYWHSSIITIIRHSISQLFGWKI